jgi:enamine deaminase RidA (YjgF/YER057c/UK114 family)
VRQEIFGSHPGMTSFRGVQQDRFGAIGWPVTSVAAPSCSGLPLAGVHCLAIAGADIETIASEGRAVGTIFSDGAARHCILGGIVPKGSPLPRDGRTTSAFEELAGSLRAAGMALADVARTWLFLDDILHWYDIFNRERREVFERHEVFSHCVPASTGIGAPNASGAALVAGAWAVQAIDPAVTVEQVSSPLQCSARDYGSCFSRAVEIGTPDLRRLFVSGTASIEPGGRTAHAGDIQKQIALTFDVVEAILASRGMSWQNTSRATCYFKHAGHAWALTEYLAARKLRLPSLLTEAYVCRDDLLFEIEIDALLPSTLRTPLL